MRFLKYIDGYIMGVKKRKPYWHVFVVLVGLFALLCIVFLTAFTGNLLPSICSGHSINMVQIFNNNFSAVVFVATSVLMMTCGLLLVSPRS